jgi:hypothetical protein
MGEANLGAGDEPSLRDDIADAFAEVEAPAEKPGDGGAALPDAGEAEPEEPSGDESEAPRDRPRREDGKFLDKKKAERIARRAEEAAQRAAAKAAKAAGRPAPEAGKPAPAAAAAAAAAAASKAPQSWSATERSKWDAMPPEAQAAVHRREREAAVAFQERAQARGMLQGVVSTIAPFESMIRAEQGARGEQYNPMRTVASLLNTAAALRTGSPSTKVNLVADIMAEYGLLDPRMIDALQDAIVARLEGRGGARPADLPQAERGDPRVDRILQHLEQQERAQEEREQARYSGQVQAFANEVDAAGKPAHEYFEDVREDMRDVILLAKNRGVAMTLQQAYDKACSLHPEVSKLVAQRREAERARTAEAATRRSRRAASSAPTSPVVQPRGGRKTEDADDLRGDIEEAFEELTG